MATKIFSESRGEMEAFLGCQVLGYLGLSVGDVPYVIPVNYAYRDGTIVFHCGFEGKKLDHIGANPNVCFTVAHQTGKVQRHKEGNVCHPDSDSVICQGQARIVQDVKERQQLLNAFNRSFRPDADEISLESAAKCGLVEIKVTEMTGRREREHSCTYWRHVFEES
jgi:uncharacterized protein